MKSTPKNTTEFIRNFQNYLDCFVVIGGTPTLIYLEQRRGNVPRATKDLDIVILDISEDGKGKDFLKTLSIADRSAKSAFIKVKLGFPIS
jgi:hypothetical protein